VSEQPYLFGPLWIPIKDGNPTAMSIFKRHYTARERRKVEQFIGPGEKEALITPDARALFAWRKFISDAGMRGINCAVFRTENCTLARPSELIAAACKIAWQRWPGERLYTYVDPAKLHTVKRRSREMCPWPPGRCFREAGWKPLIRKNGALMTTKSGLHIFVKLWRGIAQ
jgi:hypothetical protein